MNSVQTQLDLGEPAPPPFTLRGYQEDALAAIAAANERGIRRQLLVMPTGAGKTVVFSHLVYRMGCRTLILAHRDELIAQAVDKLRRTLGRDASIGVVKADRNETGADVLVGSIQTVSIPRRLAQLPKDLGLLIVDEAHHAAAESYKRVLMGLGCFAPDGPLLVGVTATPDRGDKKRIGNTIFEAQVFSITMLELIEQGHLCDVQARRVKLKFNLRNVRRVGGDLDGEDLSNQMIKAGAIPSIVEAYRAYGDGRKALVFTPTVRMAHEIAMQARAAGIPAEAIDGTTPEAERRQVIRNLASGVTTMVANCAVLTEGFDEPSVSCLIMARPTESRPLFVQMLGRGMRTHPGKRDCLVIDVVGNAGNHDVVSIPDVFGLPDDDGNVPSVKKAIDQQRNPPGTAVSRLQQVDTGGNLQSVKVNLFGARGMGTATFGVHWVAVSGGPLTYEVLSLGDALLKCGQDLAGEWCVVLNQPGRKPHVISRHESQSGGRAAAVRYAYAHGQPWAYKEGLRWRSNPAGERIKNYAARLGVALPSPCTAGVASDLILVHHAVHGYSVDSRNEQGATR